jgi:hypothetical protein
MYVYWDETPGVLIGFYGAQADTLPEYDDRGEPLEYDLAELEARAAALGFTDWSV